MSFLEFNFTKKRIFFSAAILIILIALPLVVLLSSRQELTDNRSSASLDGAENLTEEIISDDKTDAEVLTNANSRKKMMSDLADKNPESFLLNAIDSEAKSSLPASSDNLIENEVNLDGYINLIDTESEKEEYVFVQIGSSEELLNSYYLKLSPELKEEIEPDVKVNIKGYVIDQKLIPYQITKSNVLQAQDSTTGDHNLAIIPVNFLDKDNQEYTKSELDQRFFTDNDSVAKYFNDVTNGKVKITGKILNPVKVNMKASDVCRRPDALNYLLRYVTEEADKKVIARGENLNGFEHRAYIYPRLGPTPKTDEPCTFVAQATIGKQIAPSRNFTRMIVNGHYFKSNPSWRTSALTHEMGHNLGLGHASTLKCGNKPIDIYGKCEDDEYGEHFDLMGFQYYYYPQMSGVSKAKLGIIRSEDQLNLNQGNRTVDLYTSSKNTNNTRLIKIPRKNIGDSLYIDYRQPIGFDKKLPASVTSGAMFKIANTNKIDTRNNIYKTFLLNSSPGQNVGSSSLSSGYFNKASLKDGQEFYDEINNIRVKQLSHDQNKVTLEIKVGPPPCIRQNPTIIISPLSKSGKPGSSKTYTATIKNKDLAACSGTTYNLEVISPSTNWISSFEKQKLTIDPQKSNSTKFTVKSPQNATNGQKKFQIKITARNGQLSKSKDFKFIVVNGTNSTKTPTKAATKTPTPTKKPTQEKTPTPTQTITSTPIPNPTIEAGQTYLDLKIGLQGVGSTGDNSQPNGNFGNKNPEKKQAKVNIKIYGPNNVIEQELNENLLYNSANGKYVGTVKLKNNFPSGFYNIFIDSPSYLLKKIDINLENGKINPAPDTNLSGGDINNDKTRNLLDWNLILACSIFKLRNESLCPANSLFMTNSDLNSNGIVNQDDINLWLREFFEGRRL